MFATLFWLVMRGLARARAGFPNRCRVHETLTRLRVNTGDVRAARFRLVGKSNVRAARFRLVGKSNVYHFVFRKRLRMDSTVDCLQIFNVTSFKF